MVIREGKYIGVLEFVKITIVDEVKSAVNKWSQFANTAGVSNTSKAITKTSKENF